MPSVKRKLCSVDGCEIITRARGYCINHYSSFMTHGDPLVSKRRHGMSDVDGYSCWENMRQRCNNPKVPKYGDYGGRGITVCERWNDFTKFYEDMGKRPSLKHSVERKDVNKGYSPDNCFWATQTQQMRNTRVQLKEGVGVIWIADRQVWWARININYKTKHLGSFKTRAEAIAARKAAELRYWS